MYSAGAKTYCMPDVVSNALSEPHWLNRHRTCIAVELHITCGSYGKHGHREDQRPSAGCARGKYRGTTSRNGLSRNLSQQQNVAIIFVDVIAWDCLNAVVEML